MTADGSPASRRCIRLSQRLERINSIQFEKYIFVDLRIELASKATRSPDRLPVIDAHALGGEFRCAVKKVAGTKRITFHAIRHAFASMLMKEGGAKMIPALSKSLGHSSPKFTMERCIHFIEGDEGIVRDAIDCAIDAALESNGSLGEQDPT